MPTAKPRVLVTLEPETDGILRRLAAIQTRSVASIVREILEEARPVLGEAADALEALSAVEGAARARMAAGAIADWSEANRAITPHVQGILGHLGALASLGDADEPHGPPTGSQGQGTTTTEAGRAEPLQAAPTLAAAAPATPRIVTRGSDPSRKGGARSAQASRKGR